MGSFGVVEVHPAPDDPLGLEAVGQFMEMIHL
jgi:hypothetical protein